MATTDKPAKPKREKKPPAAAAEPKIGEGKAGPGRPAGVPTKRQVGDLLRVRELLDAKGYDPIAELIDLAQKTSDPKQREYYAMTIMPYVYSKQPTHIQAARAEGDEDGAGPRGGFTLNVVL